MSYSHKGGWRTHQLQPQRRKHDTLSSTTYTANTLSYYCNIGRYVHITPPPFSPQPVEIIIIITSLFRYQCLTSQDASSAVKSWE